MQSCYAAREEAEKEKKKKTAATKKTKLATNSPNQVLFHCEAVERVADVSAVALSVAVSRSTRTGH